MTQTKRRTTERIILLLIILAGTLLLSPKPIKGSALDTILNAADASTASDPDMTHASTTAEFVKQTPRTSIFVILEPGETIQFHEFDGWNAVYESSNPNYVTVDADGVITAVSIGASKITVTGDDDLKSNISVIVSDLMQNSYVKKMEPGCTEQIMNFIYWNPVYTSSDPSVVTVSSDGTLKAVKEGTAIISVLDRDDLSNEGRIVVTVEYGSSGIVMIDMYPEETCWLDEYADWDPVFESSDPFVATVSENCLLTAHHFGEAVITVYGKDNQRKTIEVYVSKVLYRDVSVEMMAGEVKTIATYLGWDAVFESSDLNVVTVTQDGIITAVGNGNAVITVRGYAEDMIAYIYISVEGTAVQVTTPAAATTTIPETTTTETTTTIPETTTTETTTTIPETTTTETTTTIPETTTTETTTTIPETTTTETTTTIPETTATETTTTIPETTTTETTTTEPVASNSKGDVNKDGTLNLKDVVQMRRFIAGGWNAAVDEIAADVNGDGTINLKDCVMLRRYIAGGWNIELNPTT